MLIKYLQNIGGFFFNHQSSNLPTTSLSYHIHVLFRDHPTNTMYARVWYNFWPIIPPFTCTLHSFSPLVCKVCEYAPSSSTFVHTYTRMLEYDIFSGLSYPHLRANYSPFHIWYVKYAGMPPPLSPSIFVLLYIGPHIFVSFNSTLFGFTVYFV